MEVDDSVAEFTGHGDHVYTCTLFPKSELLNPQGKYMLSGGGDDRVLVWDVTNTESPIAELKDFTDSVEFISFNFDNTMMLAAGLSNPVQVYTVN